jgi:hypothetical protein
LALASLAGTRRWRFVRVTGNASSTSRTARHGGGQCRWSRAHNARLVWSSFSRSLFGWAAARRCAVKRTALEVRVRFGERWRLCQLCKPKVAFRRRGGRPGMSGGVLGNASCRLMNIVESLGARFDNKLVAEIGDRHLLLLAVTPRDREIQRGRNAAAVALGGGPVPG